MTKTTTFDDRADALKESVRGLADAGSDRANEIKSRVADAKDQVVLRANTYLARAKRIISANPLASVGIAFGVGYIAMRILRR